MAGRHGTRLAFETAGVAESREVVEFGSDVGCVNWRILEMQGQDTEKSSNVVSLFGNRANQPTSESLDTAPATKTEAEAEEFKDVISKNMKNRERLAKERANANKSVLRSYRIKH